MSEVDIKLDKKQDDELSLDDKVDILKAQIEVLKDKCADNAVTFDRQQNKMLAFLGFVFALLGVLSVKWSELSLTVLASKVFFGISVVLLVSAILVALYRYSFYQWLAFPNASRHCKIYAKGQQA